MRHIFPLTYGGARHVVKRAGKRLGIKLRPHDLRRYAATFASRSGVPLEVVSQVILRHKSVDYTEISGQGERDRSGKMDRPDL